MTSKTDLLVEETMQQPERLPKKEIWILFLLGVGVLVLFSMFVNMRPILTPNRTNIAVPSQGFLFPAMIVASQTIAIGSELFRGETPELVPHSLRIITLASVLIVYIVFPTIFLLRWRRKKILGNRDVTKSWLFRLDALYFISAMSICVSVTIGAPLGYFNRTQLHKAWAAQIHRDKVIDEIGTIATKVIEYRILSKEFGGGAGSVKGFMLPTEWLATKNATYVAVVQDTMVNLQATSALYPNSMISALIIRNGKIRLTDMSGKFNP